MRFFDDIDLLILMSMMIETIKEPKDENIYAYLAESANSWQREIEGYGPGVIELGLDASLRETIAREAFVSVLSDVRTRLQSFGEWVPLEFLNGLIMFPLLAKTRPEEQVIKISQAQPASRLLKVVRDLEELVAGQE
jgi:hypothetical protein